MRGGLSGAAFALGCVIFASAACAPLPTGQMPATVPRGQARAHVGLHALATRDAPLGLPPGDLAADLGVRVGVADRLDVGGRVFLLDDLGGELGVKVQALRGPVDLAVAPALSYGHLRDERPGLVPWAATLTIPLVAGWNVHRAVTLLLGPGVSVTRTGAPRIGGDVGVSPPPHIPGAGTRFVLSTGAAFRIEEALWIAPELALARALGREPDHAWSLALGFSVFFGRCR